MYKMVKEDSTALLDPDKFLALTEKTFSTFFQHFISNNNSLETGGGWGYQEVNTKLPADIDANNTDSKSYPVIEATVSQRVEMLKMNSVAVWISIGILCWLVLTTVMIAILQRRYFDQLVRNVESLGDVLVLVAGSPNLLQVVRDIQSGHLSKGEFESLLTRLGWFVDQDGELRWGIEMEKPFKEGPDIKWVSSPYFSDESGAKAGKLNPHR